MEQGPEYKIAGLLDTVRRNIGALLPWRTCAVGAEKPGSK